MKIFEFIQHIGKYRVLVNTRDIANGAVTGEKIAQRVIDWAHIAIKSIRNEHLADAAVDDRVLGDAAVDTQHLKDNAVTPEKVSGNFVERLVQPLIDALSHKHDEDIADIKNEVENMKEQIDSMEITGIAVSNEFGSEEHDKHIAASKFVVTEAFNRLWQKIEDITGEIIQGINMVATPTYFISDDGCDITISANTVEANGIFERIQFFVDGELIFESLNAHYVGPFHYHLDSKDTYDYVVMCKAKIMGIEYTRPQIVTRYNEFYIGAGNTYTDIMDSAHAKQLNGTMRHNYDVTFEEGDKLIIVMGASLRPGFIRADLNGAEIALAEETVTIDDKLYVVFTSEAWSAGDHNIDING